MAETKTIDINLDKLKKRSITVGTLLFVMALAYPLHEYVQLHVFKHVPSRVEAQAMDQRIAQTADAAKKAADAAESVGRSLKDYIERQDLKESRDLLNMLKQQLGETQLWESSNGANDLSRARKADLQRQIDSLTSYIQCLEAERDNCVR